MPQRIFHSLLDALLALVAPQSLSGSTVLKRATQAAKFQRLEVRTSQVQAGDIILTRTPGAFYEFCRRRAGQAYDHLAIVMNANEFLHVGPPRIRLLPVPLLLNEARNPLVVRPDLNELQRTQLLLELSSMVGAPYDVARVYKFTLALWMCSVDKQHRFSPTFLSLNTESPNLCGRCFTIDCKCPSTVVGAEHGSGLCGCTAVQNHNVQKRTNYLPQKKDNSFYEHGSGLCGCLLQPKLEMGYRICTDAIVNRLLEVSPKHREEALSIWPLLDVHKQNSWSMNDLETLMRMFPRSLRQVDLARLPPPTKSDLSDSESVEAELWTARLFSFGLMFLLLLSPVHVGARTAFAAAAVSRLVMSKL